MSFGCAVPADNKLAQWYQGKIPFVHGHIGSSSACALLLAPLALHWKERALSVSLRNVASLRTSAVLIRLRQSSCLTFRPCTMQQDSELWFPTSEAY